MNPDNSIAYNPLELIKRQYILGNYSKAEKYTGVLTNQIYFDPNAKDPFWNDSASNLIKAIILALLVQCDLNNELEKFSMYNVAKMLSNLGGNTDKDENNLLDVYFKNYLVAILQKMHMHNQISQQVIQEVLYLQ